MNIIKNLKSRWSMKPTGQSFTDVVTYDKVQFWKDCYGDEWMAVSKFGDRVKCENKMVELSKMNPMWEIDEVVNYILDNGYDGIVNDCTHPNVNYGIDDLYDNWDKLKQIL
jgi:hypothetical protein